jgi:phosphoribosylcarboxyaminoimidazole (NCAIR) mutase
MVLAVPRKEQEPQEGHARFSRDMKSSSVIFPAASIPRASVSDVVSDFLPSKTTPPAMGPPVTMMAGMSSLAAAMSMPGKILSQGLAFGLHLESDDLFVGS